MPPSSESIRVLHVDDEPDFAEMAAIFVEREDNRFDIETATSTNEGLELLARGAFDCVVSDYDIPGQNGIEFLEEVRADYSDLPFILFTGKGSEEVASDAISAGVTDYLQKGGGTEQYKLLANRVQNAVEQYRSQQRAAELDRIRTLASDINQALVRAESRADIETRVCEIISDADPYLFAWVGDIDTETNRIEPRTWAGIEDGYLDNITITADESPTGQGPGGTAIRERRVAVSQNVVADPEFEPWRDKALARGYRSVAAVPMEYEKTLYGELLVYAERPNAFDDDEKELLGELGDDIAHAIAALDHQEELRSEKERFRQLTDSATDAIVTIDTDSTIQFANPAVEDIFGYKPNELVGETLVKLMPDRYRDRHRKALARFLETGERHIDWSDIEFTGLHKNGQEIDLNIAFATFEREDEQYFEGIIRDVSRRKNRERAIEKLHSTNDALMEARTAEEVAEITANAVHEILEMPANGVHLYNETENRLVPAAWTAETEELVGEPPTFAPGEGLAGTAFETGDPKIYDDISTVSDRYNSDTVVRSQIIFPLADHGVLVIGSPESDAFDDVDVSLAETLAAHATAALDRNEREQKLQKERDFIDKALDALDDIFYVVGPSGELRRWNVRLPEATGYMDEEITDMHAVEFFPADDSDKIADAIEGTLTTGYSSVEGDLLTVHGDRIPYEFKGDRLTDPAGEFVGLVGIGRDISTRKEREEELRRQQSLFEAILETSIDGILVVDENREYVTWNQQFIDMWGIPEDFVGDKPERMGLEHVLDKLENPQQFIEKVEYLYEHPQEESRDEIQLADGRVFDRYSSPVETDDGAYVSRVWFFRDITERKERERELTRQNDRLEKFASVVSHDLRNPLNVAQGRLALAREQYKSEDLDSASQAVDRSLTLIDDLLMLAREGETVSDVEAVDLAKICENCWQTVETSDATLEIETDQTIRADPGRLKQLLENLMRNAVEHGGERVTITVGDLANGFYVADDGPGISEDIREKVFEAGYSSTDEGTGFGLNIVNEIIEAHGWDITVTDTKNGGTRFEITGIELPDR